LPIKKIILSRISNNSLFFLIFWFCSVLQADGQFLPIYCTDGLRTSMLEAKYFAPFDLKIAAYHEEVPWEAQALSKYIQVPSLSGEERAAGAFFLELATLNGLHTLELPGPNNAFNAVVSLFPLDLKKPNVIFINHIDVVQANNTENWRYPPFSGAIEEGCVWGRGAYDNKGSAIIQLSALIAVSQNELVQDSDINISILLLSGEEVFSDGGAKFVAEHYLDVLNPLAFIGEGPAGVKGMVASKPDQEVYTIALSHKSALWLKLSLEYESIGHGSVPPQRYPSKDLVEAISKLLSKKQPIQMNAYNASLLQGLGDLEGGIKGFFMKNIHFLKPLSRSIIRKEPLYNAFFSNTISLTEIKTYPEGKNSIPYRAEAILDCRLLPETNQQKFIKQLKKDLKNPNIQVEIVQNTPSALPSSPTHPIYTLAESAIKEESPQAVVVPIMLPATIDSNFFRAKGYASFCFVPILMTKELLSKVHGDNERVPISSLVSGADILTVFMNRLITNSQQLANYIPGVNKL
jgi:carboxypeptidase PM20D1